MPIRAETWLERIRDLLKDAPQTLIPSTAADQRLTITNAAVVQMSTLASETTHVLWTLETNNVRVTLDGSNPTITNGHLFVAGASGVWKKELAIAAKFIAPGANCILHVTELKA
jgi:hypothetical protein